MKINIRMYPQNNEEIKLLTGLINKYKFGSKRFYDSFDLKTNCIDLFNRKIKVDTILSHKIVNEELQVYSFVIREGIENDLLMEVSGFINPSNTIKTKYAERRKTSRTY